MAGTGKLRLACVCGCGEVTTQTSMGQLEHRPAWLLGTSSVQGNAFIPAASKARLQLPSADWRKRHILSLRICPTHLFPRPWCVRNMPASKALFSPFPPSGMPPPPSFLNVSIPSSWGHGHPEPIQIWGALPPLDSPGTYCISITDLVLGTDRFVWSHLASCRYPISQNRFLKISVCIHAVILCTCIRIQKKKKYRRELQTAKISLYSENVSFIGCPPDSHRCRLFCECFLPDTSTFLLMCVHLYRHTLFYIFFT